MIRFRVPAPNIRATVVGQIGGREVGGLVEVRSKAAVVRLLKLWLRFSPVYGRPLLRAAKDFAVERAKWRPWGDKRPLPADLAELERLYLLEAGRGTRPTQRAY